MKHKIDDKLSFKYFLAVTLPEDCAELITDPLKVFDSFSVFVEPISYQRIFHLVSVFYITADLVNIILEMQLTLISARRATDSRS